MSEKERVEIVDRASEAGLSQSAFLRCLALNISITSVLDQETRKELVRINADLGRIAGLLKLWLATRRGEGAKASDVEAMMNEFRSLQRQLMNAMGRIAYDR